MSTFIAYGNQAGAKNHTLRTYAGSRAPKEMTAMTTRLFGTWTLLSGIVRLYAAYNVADKAAYTLALSTFGVAGAHFGLELLIFGTMRWDKGFLFPALVAYGTPIWMLTQWSYYVH